MQRNTHPMILQLQDASQDASLSLLATESEKKNDKPRHYLILGCGQTTKGCKRNHPKDCFITVDIYGENKPDYFANAASHATLDRILEENNNEKFSAIIYEYLPNDAINYHFFSYLKENGCLVFMGLHIFDLIKNMPCNQQIITFTEPGSNSLSMAIAPTTNFNYHSDPILQKYFASYLVNSTKYEFLITPEIKTRANFLTLVLNDLKNIYHGYKDNYIILLVILFKNSKKSPVCIEDIKSMCAEYKPGFFRRNLTTEGKTTGIKEIENYISTHSGTLSRENIEQLLLLIYERQYRLWSGWNFTRTIKGSTSQVQIDITIHLLSQLLDEKEKMSSVSGKPTCLRTP